MKTEFKQKQTEITKRKRIFAFPSLPSLSSVQDIFLSVRPKRNHPPFFMKTNPETLEHILSTEQMKPDAEFLREPNRRLELFRADLECQLVEINRNEAAVTDLREHLPSLLEVETKVGREVRVHQRIK